MADGGSIRQKTLGVASATVLAVRRYLLTDANGLATYPSAGSSAVGISMDASAAGSDRAIPVAMLDGAIIEIEAGAAVEAGAVIATDATGRAVTAASGDRLLGRAETAASAAGEWIRVDTTLVPATLA